MINNIKPDQLEVPLMPSSLETIDFSVFNFINDDINAFCATNKGWEKVQVIWASKERVAQNQDNEKLRDQNRTLIFPLISIRKVGMPRSNRAKGKFFTNIYPVQDHKRGSITIARFLNQEETATFANADAFRKNKQINFPAKKNNKQVYEWISIPMPSYLEVHYEIGIRTEYQQQMNEILEAFTARTGNIRAVLLKQDGHTYQAFWEEDPSLEDNTDDFQEEARKYETKYRLRVYGYLIGAGNNQKEPKIIKRQNWVQVKIPREKAIFGDIPQHTPKGSYKE